MQQGVQGRGEERRCLESSSAKGLLYEQLLQPTVIHLQSRFNGVFFGPTSTVEFYGAFLLWIFFNRVIFTEEVQRCVSEKLEFYGVVLLWIFTGCYLQ